MGSLTSQPVVNPLVDGVPEPVILTLISSPDTAVAHVGQWEITRFPFTIGRENADLTIANDRHISRQHARLTFEGNDYFLEDLGSSNGTFVNETKIAAREPVPLRTDRDSRIQIGRTTIFTFHVVPPEPSPEPNGAAVAPTAVGQNGAAR
ncbi:MAG: FHA domain-containing protein [Chloroflexi bacterium]|nr:FHA domain-containing protein [Chloroflexota bacterium]